MNPYSCHRKGGAIVTAGADLRQLGGAVAFELETDQESRRKQLEFNIAQAVSPQGMMPLPSGQERFLPSEPGLYTLRPGLNGNTKMAHPTKVRMCVYNIYFNLRLDFYTYIQIL